ncbi:MAG: VWA domain-containing protein [Acidobacteria bacterium]|nr:MAG: VWA domain-containing protein [Acidobacteriota bacterium]
MSEKIEDILTRHLRGIPASRIESLAEKLNRVPGERALVMLDVGIGLAGSSLRAALEFFRVGPDIAHHLDIDELRVWGKICRRLVTVNPEVAMSFFQSSARVLGTLPKRLRGLALTVCDRQAMISTSVALECFQAAPRLIEHLVDEHTAEQLYEIAYEVSRRSATQSAELLATAPRTLAFLRQEHRGPIRRPGSDTPLTSSPEERRALLQEVLRLTALFAHRAGGLATEFFSQLPQTLPETDPGLQKELLVHTRTFLERSGGVALQYFIVAAQILAEMGPRTLRRWTALTEKISAQGNATVYNFLKATPEVIARLSALGQRRADALGDQVLTLIEEIGQHNIFLAIECFKSSPTALRLGSFEQFAHWARAGLRLHHQDARRAYAYYTLETQTSQRLLKESTGGVMLDHVIHTLRLYVEGLAGRELSVQPLPAFHLSQLAEHLRLGDGRTVYLPAAISEYDDFSSNFRLYKVLAAYGAGHIEFGTYERGTTELQSVLERVEADFADVEASPPSTLPEDINYLTVLSRFPHREFATRVFTLVESGRIEHRLRHAYRGLNRDLDFFRARLQKHAPPLDTLSPDRAFMQLLVDMTIGGGATDQARALYPHLVQQLEAILHEHIGSPTATVADSLMAAHRIYRLALSTSEQLREAQSPSSSADQGERQGEPESIADASSALQEQDAETVDREAGERPSDHFDHWVRVVTRRPPSHADPHQTFAHHGAATTEDLDPQDHVYYYEEWDRELADFRPHWCRIIEKSARRGGRQFVEYVRSFYGPLISSIRYQFQLLRPEALKKIRGEIDGEDFDLQAVIDYALDRRTSGRVSERLYVRRLRKRRDVAVSFLLDMSSSTARTVGRGRRGTKGRMAKRIIDIEKEGLVLMSEALEAVGDLYSIQGFTSEGRHRVKFYIVKDFDEPYGPAVESRIGGITYQNNTRLGAAIRHAAARLTNQPAQTKLLIVLSDGRPYDQDYGDSHYAREDTKMALRQARMEGITPFCITIDRESEPHLRDMYGDVRYTIIDDIFSLPERLPGIYRRLTE